jgi:hypothetical protein
VSHNTILLTFKIPCYTNCPTECHTAPLPVTLRNLTSCTLHHTMYKFLTNASKWKAQSELLTKPKPNPEVKMLFITFSYIGLTKNVFNHHLCTKFSTAAYMETLAAKTDICKFGQSSTRRPRKLKRRRTLMIPSTTVMNLVLLKMFP